MTGGQIVLNGVRDEDIIIILQEKTRLKSFGFNVQVLVPTALPPVAGKAGGMGYNGATLTWKTDEELKDVTEVVRKLLHHQGHHSQP